MSLEIRSTRIVEAGTDRALAEILISDHADENKAVESIRIRVKIPLQDTYLPAMQDGVIRRANEIFKEIERGLMNRWSSVRQFSVIR